MRDDVKGRRYRSPLRDRQAELTRERILLAAGELFTQRGYAATTMSAIAERAEVAVDTVYAVFGSKRALVTAMMDLAVAGDAEPMALLDREEPQRMRAETDQRRQLSLFAAGVTRLLERVAPLDDVLRGAAAVDPEIAALRVDLQQRQRRQAMNTVAGWLVANGPLRDGLAPADAGAILWTLTSPEVHHLLRRSCRWSRQRYEDWLGDTLTRTLLRD